MLVSIPVQIRDPNLHDNCSDSCCLTLYLFYMLQYKTINKKGMKDARLFRYFTAYVERWKRIFEIHDIFRKSSIVCLKYDS